MTKVYENDNGETIELTVVEEDPNQPVMAEIYSSEGWLVWYVGLFATEAQAFQAAVTSTRR